MQQDKGVRGGIETPYGVRSDTEQAIRLILNEIKRNLQGNTIVVFRQNAFEEVMCKILAILHDDVIKWKHFPRYWPFVTGIHRSTVNSPHKGQWHGALMCSSICAWKKSWVNNHDSGDLQRHRTHYDANVMLTIAKIIASLCNGKFLTLPEISIFGIDGPVPSARGLRNIWS